MSKRKLYLFVGYPGAGKTTIAQAIAKQTGAKHLWADVERHKLFPKPTHSIEESTALYRQLNDATDYLLQQGRSVVFDTNFNYAADRQKLRDIADKHGAETIIVWVDTPLDIAKQRAVHSQVARNGYDFVMSESQFDDIARKLEPPTESEKVLKIDGTNFDESSLAALG